MKKLIFALCMGAVGCSSPKKEQKTIIPQTPCNYELPIGSTLMYNDITLKYAIVYDGRDVGLPIRWMGVSDSQYSFYGGEVALFDDSCAAKHAFRKAVYNDGGGMTFKPIHTLKQTER